MTRAAGQAKGVNRADLLRTLLKAGEQSLNLTAELSGFVPPVRRKVRLNIPSVPIDKTASGKLSPVKPPKKTQLGRQAQYYRVIGREASGLLPEPNGQVSRNPPWYEDAPTLNPDEIKSLPVQPPDKEPLVAWAKLWPVLRAQLSEIKRTRRPDIPRVVKILANGELLHAIPRKSRQQWTAAVQILVDRPERTSLFNQDYNQLLVQLKHLRGVTGLEMQTVVRQPGGLVRINSGGRPQVRDWHPPVAGTAVLILSDLGLLDETGMALRAWLRMGRQLCLAGCRPVAFVPLPARYLTAELISLFGCISWDRGSSLQPVTYVPPRSKAEQTPLQRDAEAGAKRLLAWLSPAVRVEPALLRAVRHHLPIQTMDAGTEAAAWHHEDVVRSPIGFHFQSKTLEGYRQQFAAQAKVDPLLAQAITATILAYHRHVFPTQRYEELLILAQLLRDRPEKFDQQEVEVARNHMRQLVKASLTQQEAIPSLPGFVRQHYFERQHPAMRREYDFLQAIWSLRKSERGIGGELTIPDGFDPHTVSAFLNKAATSARDYVLFQQGMQALQVATRQRFDAAQDGFTQGSPLAEFRSVSSVLLNQYTGADGVTRSVLLPLNDVQTQFMPLEEEDRQQLHIAGEKLTIERFTKPAWAVSIGRSHGALTAASQPAAGRRTWYWHPPEWQSETGMQPGFWYYLPPETGNLKPEWATEAGRDEYGLYADADIAGIIQRLRWIEPTCFLMGSPENEPGRYERETQHRVILTRGYWLADTACTQALWQAVTGDNPSEFKGEDKPVETVSWNDIEEFLLRLNRLYPDLKLRLPTEAEWENACRAGTSEAFSFEGELSLDKVNYRGTWEYAGDSWGEGAPRRSATVKSYPPNAWGLYEMHGNVWEWCKDWYDDYPTEPVLDPQGAGSGAYRVLRGGSWIRGGRDCRSACRARDDPGNRDLNLGFRLARGLELPVRSGASQQPVGTPASERGGHKRGMDGGSAGESKKPAKSSTRKNKPDY